MRLNALAASLVASLAVLALAACSSAPTKPSANAPTSAAPPVMTSADLTSAAKPAAADPAKPGAQTPVLDRTRVAAGYRATTIKGETYYCRMADVIGTNFKRKVCLNEAQLQEEERKTQEMQDRMIRQQASPSCMGPTCGG